jgi:nucleoid-associated protein YejK
MHIINLKINKIVIHQIFKRKEDGNMIMPARGNSFIKFDASALDTFRIRVTDALGEKSKAVEMSIFESDEKSTPYLISKLHDASDTQYIEQSYEIAKILAQSQKKTNMPGGIVAIFTGTFGSDNRKFVGVIKAEIYSAYQKKVSELTEEITLEYVKEAILTPATKLYKTAGFFERKDSCDSTNIEDRWDVFISDSQISKLDGKAAAKYFYSNFLGCCYPESSARTTKKFYEATQSYIKNLELNPETKSDFYNALNGYLKYELSGLIAPKEFGTRYFSAELLDDYIEHLTENDVPTTAFTRDTEHILSKLKTRKISFKHDVRLTAPADAFRNLVEIKSIEEDASGNPVSWTQIIVKEKIVAQE